MKSLNSPRLIRVITSNNWSIHDLILVDCKSRHFCGVINPLTRITAPEFHLVIQQGSNGEVYNMAIRGWFLQLLNRVWAAGTDTT